MSHLSDEQLSALADGALAGGARAEAERHLEACAACREALAALVAQDQALHGALEHDPGDAYFADFAARVGGRIRAAGLQGAQVRAPEGRGLADWFRAPRKLAAVGAVATVVVGVGIVMLATREVRLPAVSGRQIEERIAQRAPAEEVPAAPSPTAAPRPSGGGQAGVVRHDEAGPAAPAGSPALADRERGTGTEERLAAAREAPALGAAPPPARREAERASGAAPSVAVQENELKSEATAMATDAGKAEPPRPAAPMSAEEMSGARSLAGATDRAAAPMAARLQERAMKSAKGRTAPGRICGTVRDDRGRPVAGAQVVNRATGAGVASASDGSFCLESDERETRIAVMAVGFQPVWRAVASGERAEIVLAAAPVLGARPGAGSARDADAPALGAAGDLTRQPTFIAVHVQNARRLTARAAELGLAPAWDSAAGEWEMLLTGVEGGPLELETRLELARARFRAWRAEATERRATRAREALDGYLAAAPRGADRDTVERWRGELGK